MYLQIDKFHKPLAPERDAATQNMGSKWRTPIIFDTDELFNTSYTYIKCIILNGIKGMLITSRINGKSIFIPFAGGKDDSSLKPVGIFGRGEFACMWTSIAVMHKPPTAIYWGGDLLYDKNSGLDMISHFTGDNAANWQLCMVGLCVRGVCEGSPFEAVDAKGNKYNWSAPMNTDIVEKSNKVEKTNKVEKSNKGIVKDAKKVLKKGLGGLLKIKK